MSERVRTLIVLVPFGILGLSLLGLGLYWIILGHQARSWTEVQGLIQTSQASNSRIKGQGVSGIRISYRYEFSGRQYEGGRVSFGGIDKNQVEKIRYVSGGDRVLVYVDPKEPERSVLVPGVMLGAQALLIFGGFILVVIASILRSLLPPSP